jgi:hypothetical protein
VDAPPVAVCSCGEAVELPSRTPGARRVCPACGRLVENREPGAPLPASGPIPAGLRLTLSLLFGLAFLPLLLGGRNEGSAPRVVRATSVRAINDWFEQSRVRSLPGAAFERGSATPWILAIVAAEVFWAYLLVAFPWGTGTLRKCLGAGALALVVAGFTLLVLKWGASLAFDGDTYRPRGKSALLYYLLKFLGFSYQAGVDPRNGIGAAWLAFTFGAGMLLSACRALPVLLWYRKNRSLDARGAVAWGLVAGASVGAMQAGFYGGSFYDGLAGGATYVQMIVSGVAMSAVCGGLSALVVWRLEEDVLAMDSWWEWVILILVTGAAGSVPHGLYDTLWKSGRTGGAFAAGVATFAVFIVLYGWAVRKEKLYVASAERSA